MSWHADDGGLTEIREIRTEPNRVEIPYRRKVLRRLGRSFAETTYAEQALSAVKAQGCGTDLRVDATNLHLNTHYIVRYKIN